MVQGLLGNHEAADVLREVARKSVELAREREQAVQDPARRIEAALGEPFAQRAAALDAREERGEPVELIPEPKNPADPRAVAVFSTRGVQLGYLTAERCGRIGALIRDGREVRAVFQEATSYGAVIRAAFDGEEPVLPPKRQPEPPDAQDFWPDPEWPDE